MDVTTETFEKEVIERSGEVPVVVDFWADWCGPCKALTPVLEQAVAEQEGGILLAKVDTDANPELSDRYGVRGIPNVKAFRDGRVVDEFVGALPPQAVKAFLAGLTGPSAAERLLDELRGSGEFPEILGPLAEGDHERVLEWLLGELESATPERRERIRVIMVSLFGDLGQEHPVTTHYRRRLASALY
ncbi:MAG TPA: tetratricopeptide repeat protein [Gaiellaceae bacterium]|nr:tetratricopeptide repeat protein [Gaiellaceae bacterium]